MVHRLKFESVLNILGVHMQERQSLYHVRQSLHEDIHINQIQNFLQQVASSGKKKKKVRSLMWCGSGLNA